jgi:drug/metabolite transporter (DMT)-like permease
VRHPGSGAAWGSFVAGLLSVAALPLAVFLTRFSESYELLEAGFAIPVAAALGIVAIALSRRARRQASVRLGGERRSGPAATGRVLGIVGLCIALAGVVSLVVYALLDYVGSRE